MLKMKATYPRRRTDSSEAIHLLTST